MTQGNPPQDQSQPGRQHEMEPEPRIAGRGGRGSGRLNGRTAIVTGGDSGIGRSVAVLLAREGADVAVVYLEEHDDAKETGEQAPVDRRRSVCGWSAGPLAPPTRRDPPCGDLPQPATRSCTPGSGTGMTVIH